MKINMKILVLGGTRFFGKRAVEKLVDNGHEVTIATRGNTPAPFDERVKHVILDVQDKEHPGWKDIVNQSWDAVFNNILYTKEDAELMIEKFSKITDHFYFTSSLSVYSGDKDGYAEDDFDPIHFEIAPDTAVDYAEGKRQAEHILFTKAPFSVTAFRFPIVLDTDDYTKRLHYYIEKAINGETIYLAKSGVKINFVKGSTAADSIVWAIENKKQGIYNISSIDAVTIDTLMDWIEEAVEKELTVGYTGKNYSPFSANRDWYLNSDKINEERFRLEPLEKWLKPLIQTIAEKMQVTD